MQLQLTFSGQKETVEMTVKIQPAVIEFQSTYFSKEENVQVININYNATNKRGAMRGTRLETLHTVEEIQSNYNPKKEKNTYRLDQITAFFFWYE